MKIISLIFLALLPLLALADHHHSSTPALKEMSASPAPYRHVVCFKFKDEASPDQIEKIETQFAALKAKIDSITHIEWGQNVSPENHAQGFTHCFIVSFKDKAGLDLYLPHPAHKDFVKLLLPSLDKVFVIDFIAQSVN